MEVIRKSELPAVRLNGEVAAHILDGGQHGGLSSSAFIVDVGPGQGPHLHRHPYDEIFVIISGRIRLEADGEVTEASPEEICVVRAGVSHTFSNLGPGRAQMVNIHATSHVVTEFVDDGRDQDAGYEYGHTS